MGRIFDDPVIGAQSRPLSYRKQQYLATKTTDRKRVEKREQSMQIELCSWILDTFPGVHFRSDTGSGAFGSKWEKNTHNRQQSSTKLPDLTIYAMRRGFGALMLELKAEGESLKMKRDGRTIRIRKDKRGKIIERDYKIRLKGDWASLHIEQQHDRMVELRDAGYAARFAVGIDEAKKIICWYMGVPYIETAELF